MIEIYKTTNLVNNKIYIGQYNCTRKGYLGGGKLIKQAIRKYGKNKFKKEIIVKGDFNQCLTDELERHYIRLYNSNNLIIGYNLETGGIRGENKGKLSNKGYKHTKEYAENCRKRQLGKKVSQRAKQIISQKLKGIERSKETRKKMSLGRKDKVTVIQYDKTGYSKTWNSMSEAAKMLNLCVSNIWNCCHNKRKSTGKYQWKLA